jgi:CO/xanthine dehydrogenase FAD-binding subunit
MRSHPAEYELVSPGNIAAVLELLDREPGVWLPVAGGTEVMVQFSAGRLAARRLVNLWVLKELREISETDSTLTISGGCTFTQIREHCAVQKYFPLLAEAASWTGSIANQNRATIAGNIVNASPAADSPPALLAYEAELELISAEGTRRVACTDFHLGYKETALAPGELLLAIHLQKRFAGWFRYGHIGMGAVAATPLRLRKTEECLLGAALTKSAIARARSVLSTEIAPIDDIRSNAEYRRHVAGNLLEDLLDTFAASKDAA